MFPGRALQQPVADIFYLVIKARSMKIQTLTDSTIKLTSFYSTTIIIISIYRGDLETL